MTCLTLPKQLIPFLSSIRLSFPKELCIDRLPPHIDLRWIAEYALHMVRFAVAERLQRLPHC